MEKEEEEEEVVGGFLRELLLPPTPLEAYLGVEYTDGEVAVSPLGASFFKGGRVIHLPPPLSPPPSELLSAWVANTATSTHFHSPRTLAVMVARGKDAAGEGPQEVLAAPPPHRSTQYPLCTLLSESLKEGLPPQAEKGPVKGRYFKAGGGACRREGGGEAGVKPTVRTE